MTTSSRSPTKLSQAIQSEPSGAVAIAGQSSWRYSWPTMVGVICAQRGAREASARVAQSRRSISHHYMTDDPRAIEIITTDGRGYTRISAPQHRQECLYYRA